MSRELERIKEEIFNTGQVVELLESMECHSFSPKNERIDFSNPDGDNPVGASIFLSKDLTGKIWSRNVEVDDIYDMVSYYHFGLTDYGKIKKNVHKAKKYIIETLGMKDSWSEDERKDDLPDYNFHLRKLMSTKKKEGNEVLPESIMNDFVMLPHISLIKEGLKYRLLKEHEIGIDIESERIIFTYRNIDGKLVGIRGRALNKEDEKLAKYLPIYNFSKSLELYNLHRAKSHIVKHKKVFLFEGEKSSILAEGFGYPNCVSFMGSKISESQARLLKMLHPDIDYIVCMDKDKSKKDIKQASVHLPKDHVYGVWDKVGLLEGKDSPVDKGKPVFENLINDYCFEIFPNN